MYAFGGELKGETEVCEFHLKLFALGSLFPCPCQQYVFRLQVSMQSTVFTLGVEELNGLSDLMKQLGGMRFGQELLGTNIIEQLATVTQIHDEVDALGVFEGAAEAYDVRMVWEPCHQLDFVLDTLEIRQAAKLRFEN